MFRRPVPNDDIVPKPYRRPDERPPLSPSDQWALQQMHHARERAWVGRLVAAAILFGLGVMAWGWPPWPH